MIEKGDTVLIKMPTKKNPSRLIEAYVRYISEQPGKPRRLALVGSNQRKIFLYEDSPAILCKVDAGEDEKDDYGTKTFSHSQTEGNEK